MWKNHLKTAWRNIRRNKLFSVINMLGLSIGIATFFIIMLFVQNELSYDRFNIHADRIARIIFQADINGGKINEGIVMAPVAGVMKKDFPEVEDATRLVDLGYPTVTLNQTSFKGDRVALADPNLFGIFTLPMIAGNAKTALEEPHTLVLTESAAKKYFGKKDPMGKTIQLNHATRYRVTGVIKDIPANSHFHFAMIASMTGLPEAQSDSWMVGNFYTYLLLRPGTDLKKMEARFPDMVAKYMGPQIQAQMGLRLSDFRSKGNSLGFTLQPLTSIHLHSATSNEFEPGGNARYVYIFSGVALFMLLVACINFINLSTAQASKRAREVGVRKVIGSGRGLLVRQFLSESLLVTLFALAIAFLLIELALPVFNKLTGQPFHFDLRLLAIFIGLGTVVGILAGLYPACYLSSLKPASVLKGNFATAPRRFSLRSGLVTFQFFISVTLIMGTIIVYRQMQFIRHKDLGYDKEQLITLPNSYVLGKNERVFKQEMLQDPRIVSATMSGYRPAGPSNYNNALAYPRGDDQRIVNGVDYHVDEQYIPTMGMHLLSGRNFSPGMPTDSSAIILNESAAQALGWNALTAVGKTVIRQNADRGNHFPYRVIGVVRNFNFKSLHEAISPLFMTLEPESGLIFRIRTADVSGLLSTMNKAWDRYHTGEPFSYHFMDDLFNQTYAAEQKTGTILGLFSLLIILVACLGLFGLVTYASEQHTKEIGIRKVLGATTVQITQMLSSEFLKLIIIASLIAFPIAWWMMTKWLQSFAYRVRISWWIFLVSGMITLVVALATIGWQSVKAAMANPVKSLRTE